MANGYLSLPPIEPESFNRIFQQKFSEEAVCWVADVNNKGTVDPDEVILCNGGADLKKFVADEKFTSLFDGRYKAVIEARRQELVNQELSLTKLETIRTDFAVLQLPDDELGMIRHILDAGRIMDDLYHMQLGSYQYQDYVTEYGTEADKDFVARYQQPWCKSTSLPICNALSTFKQYENPLYWEGIKVEDIKGDLASPFTIGKKDAGGNNIAVPYAKSFLSPKMAEAASYLREAAKLAEKTGETYLAKYMSKVADAFESDKLFPFVESDAAWLEMKGRSKYFLRIGPDETRVDPMHIKAGFSMSFGLINQEAAKSVDMYSSIRQEMEVEIAKVVGFPYIARPINVSLPDFVNVIVENGHSRGYLKGTSSAQTLPNQCGEDGKANCSTRTMVYLNKVGKNYSPEMMRRAALLLDEDNMKYFTVEGLISSMVNHEFAHNFGPQDGMPAEDGRALKEHIGDYTSPIEELKAETGSLFLAHWLGEKGIITEEQARSIYTAEVLWMFNILKRSLGLYKEGKFHTETNYYALLSAVQLGYFIKHKAITYNEKTRKFTINYKKMPQAVKSLLHEIGQLYMRHNRDEIIQFYERYTKGKGLESLHMENIEAAIGNMPTTLYNYEIKGLLTVEPVG